MNQGLRFGYPRVLTGIVTASLCDTLLIVLGTAGASALLADADERVPVLLIGIAFLAIFGVLAFRPPPEEEADEVESVGRPLAMIAQTVGVSLFNPHAVLETVGVLGGAVAAQSARNRIGFALGVIAASWVWFVWSASRSRRSRGGSRPQRGSGCSAAQG